MVNNKKENKKLNFESSCNKLSILVAILFFYLAIMSMAVFAINATSGNYSIAMFGSGLQSSNTSSSSYNGTLLLTHTGSTRGANTTTYTSNIGFFDNVSYFRAVSITSYTISPTSAVVGSTISLSISALNSQSVWANVTSPNNQVQRLNLVNDDTLEFLPIPSVVGTYTVTFYANSSTGTIASAVDTFALTATSTTPSSGGGGGGGGGTTATCTYNWDCTPWSVCADGKQTRECKNIGTCTGTENKPIEEIDCSEALFDILLKLKNIDLNENKSLLFSYDLIEQIGVEKIDVHIKTSIIDSRNNEIFSRIETKAVQGNLSVIDKIDEIRFIDGDYILRVDILYGNLQRAFAEQKFKVENGKLEKIVGELPEREKINLTVLLILLILILATAIIIILLKKRRKRKHEVHRHRMEAHKHHKTHKHKHRSSVRKIVIAIAIGAAAIFLETSSRGKIIGFAVNEIPSKVSSNFLWILPLLILIGLLIIYRKKILSKYFSNKVLDLMDKEVYTDSGDYIGKVEEVIIEKNKIDSLRVKLDDKKTTYKTKGLIIKYSQVKGIKHVIIIKNFELGEIEIHSDN